MYNSYFISLKLLKLLQALLQDWSSKNVCTGKDLESLIGHLVHAASVVRQGRTFFRQLYDLLHLSRAPFHLIRLKVTVKADLAW